MARRIPLFERVETVKVPFPRELAQITGKKRGPRQNLQTTSNIFRPGRPGNAPDISSLVSGKRFQYFEIPKS
jgi:hypothetical protein